MKIKWCVCYFLLGPKLTMARLVSCLFSPLTLNCYDRVTVVHC